MCIFMIGYRSFTVGYFLIKLLCQKKKTTINYSSPFDLMVFKGKFQNCPPSCADTSLRRLSLQPQTLPLSFPLPAASGQHSEQPKKAAKKITMSESNSAEGPDEPQTM